MSLKRTGNHRMVLKVKGMMGNELKEMRSTYNIYESNFHVSHYSITPINETQEKNLQMNGWGHAERSWSHS